MKDTNTEEAAQNGYLDGVIGDYSALPTRIEKLEKLINIEKEKNEKLFDKSTWCREHGFSIQADVLMSQYDAVRNLIRQIEMKVIREIIDI